MNPVNHEDEEGNIHHRDKNIILQLNMVWKQFICVLIWFKNKKSSEISYLVLYYVGKTAHFYFLIFVATSHVIVAYTVYTVTWGRIVLYFLGLEFMKALLPEEEVP